MTDTTLVTFLTVSEVSLTVSTAKLSRPVGGSWMPQEGATSFTSHTNYSVFPFPQNGPGFICLVIPGHEFWKRKRAAWTYVLPHTKRTEATG